VIRKCEAGHPPVRLLSGSRCPGCARRREGTRPSRETRGYGREHQAARRALVALCAERGALPCACGCGTLVTPDTLVAAHVLDGRPEYGWVASCRRCNEIHKQRGGGGGRPQEREGRATPAPGNPTSARVSAFFGMGTTAPSTFAHGRHRAPE